MSASPGDDNDKTVAGRYRYGEHPSQYVEVSLPAGTGAVPVVVIVHGGFWKTR